MKRLRFSNIWVERKLLNDTRLMLQTFQSMKITKTEQEKKRRPEIEDQQKKRLRVPFALKIFDRHGASHAARHGMEHCRNKFLRRSTMSCICGYNEHIGIERLSHDVMIFPREDTQVNARTENVQTNKQ